MLVQIKDLSQYIGIGNIPAYYANEMPMPFIILPQVTWDVADSRILMSYEWPTMKILGMCCVSQELEIELVDSNIWSPEMLATFINSFSILPGLKYSDNNGTWDTCCISTTEGKSSACDAYFDPEYTTSGVKMANWVFNHKYDDPLKARSERYPFCFRNKETALQLPLTMMGSYYYPSGDSYLFSTTQWNMVRFLESLRFFNIVENLPPVAGEPWLEKFVRTIGS